MEPPPEEPEFEVLARASIATPPAPPPPRPPSRQQQSPPSQPFVPPPPPPPRPPPPSSTSSNVPPPPPPRRSPPKRRSIPPPPRPPPPRSRSDYGHYVRPEDWESTFGPRHKWRHNLCQCFDVWCTPLCLASCCGLTHTLVLGQLLERMGLDWCGLYDPSQAHNTCKMVSILWIFYLCMYCIGLSIVFWPVVTIWLLILGTRLRGTIRDRFNIPTQYCRGCQGRCEDCLCTAFCTCCATIQMARQTHNEHKYPYNVTGKAGLPSYAPVIFEHPMPPMDRGSTTDGANQNNSSAAPPPPPPARTEPPTTKEPSPQPQSAALTRTAEEEGAIVPLGDDDDDDDNNNHQAEEGRIVFFDNTKQEGAASLDFDNIKPHRTNQIDRQLFHPTK